MALTLALTGGSKTKVGKADGGESTTGETFAEKPTAVEEPTGQSKEGRKRNEDPLDKDRL